MREEILQALIRFMRFAPEPSRSPAPPMLAMHRSAVIADSTVVEAHKHSEQSGAQHGAQHDQDAVITRLGTPSTPNISLKL